MKILVVSSYLPFPLHSGGHIRLYNLLKELSKIHEITLICEKRSFQNHNHIKEIEKICHKVIAVDRKKQWALQNIIKSSISSASFLSVGHDNKQMKTNIADELQKNKFDLIHVETYYVAQNLPATNLPVVLVEHNIEYEVYGKFAQKAPFFLRPFLAVDIEKIKKEEEKFWKLFPEVIAVSEIDGDVIKKIIPSVTIVPNGVDLTEFKFKNINGAVGNKEKKYLFIGDFRWIQNRDSFNWIIKEIWPQVKEKLPSSKLWIVGRNIPHSFMKNISDPQVVFDTKSSLLPTAKIFQNAFALLSPIRIGGGTSYKILESLAVGTPVIATSFSAYSLGLIDEESVLTGDTSKELVEKILRINSASDLYKRISLNGRKIIEKNYSWPKIAAQLNYVYNKVV